MRRIVAYLGWLMWGLLAAGLLLRLMQPERDRIWAGFLMAGLVCAAVYVGSSFRGFQVRRLGQALSSRSTRAGASSLLLIALVLGILGAINYLADRHSEQWDFTANRQYTLSDQTLRVLENLDNDVDIVLLERTDQSRSAMDVLKLYDNASARVSVEVIDPDVEPTRANGYKTSTEARVGLGTLVIDTGERRERATAASEPEITSALIRALKQERKKLYITTGHGERDPDDTGALGLSLMNDRLTESIYDTEKLLLMRAAQDGALRVPEDARALVIAGPRTDFLPEELEALSQFLEAGGSAVVLLDPNEEASTPALIDFLTELGIAVGDDIVVDTRSIPPVEPLVQTYGEHPIVESFDGTMSVFPVARTIGRGEDVPAHVELEELFTTTNEESWAETRISELGQSRFGPAPDQAIGPVPLAVAATIGSEASDDIASRVVVTGDSDFVRNEFAAAPVLNADLFLNMVNWVAEDDDLIAIRPRSAEDRRIFLSAQQDRNVFLFSLLIIPGIVIVTGISVWWSRR